MIDVDTLKKMPKNVGYFGKLIAAKGFKNLSKVQKIAQSGHTATDPQFESSHRPILLTLL